MKPICCSPECERESVAAGYCSKHYVAERFKGTPCSVADCDRNVRVGGMCSTHYYSPLRHGRSCTKDDCSKPEKAKGLCAAHLSLGDRVCRICSTPFVGKAQTVYCSPECRRAGRVITHGIGYVSAHNRLRREMGSADLYACTDCAGPASQWSYTYGDPDELVSDRGSSKGCPYSLDSAFYVPRCPSCHYWHDLRQRQPCVTSVGIDARGDDR